MNCPRCNQPVNDNDVFCQNCGERIISRSNNEGEYGKPPKNNKNNNAAVLIIGILSALVICVAAALIMYFVYSGSVKANATPSPMPTPAASPTAQVVYVTPEPTPQVIYVTPQPPQAPPPANNAPAPQPDISGYRTYYSDKYSFGCNYPASFIPYDDYGSTLYTLQSPDGLATEKISAKANSGETVNSELNYFLAIGSVEYKSSGKDYFAARVRNGSTYYYKYCKFKNGNLYWFEFSYPVSQHGVYDSYINDIYSSISIP